MSVELQSNSSRHSGIVFREHRLLLRSVAFSVFTVSTAVPSYSSADQMKIQCGWLWASLFNSNSGPAVVCFLTVGPFISFLIQSSSAANQSNFLSTDWTIQFKWVGPFYIKKKIWECRAEHFTNIFGQFRGAVRDMRMKPYKWHSHKHLYL